MESVKNWIIALLLLLCVSIVGKSDPTECSTEVKDQYGHTHAIVGKIVLQVQLTEADDALP